MSSRFDDLFSTAKKSASSSETEQPKPSPKKSKSNDPNYIRTTVYLPKQLHRKLKSVAADEGREMSEIVEESVVRYLESQNNNQENLNI